MSMIRCALAQLKHEYLLTTRSRGQWAQPLIFFVLISLILPMLCSEELSNSSILSVSLIWLSVLLSTLLTLNTALRLDYQDGILDQWLLSSYPLWWLMTVKSLAHWLFWIAPMLVFSPLMMLLLKVDHGAIPSLLLSLLIGTPVFSFVGLMSTSFTLMLRSSGLLIALIMIPLCLPVLFLGTGPAQSQLLGIPLASSLAFLGACTILAILLVPHAASVGIKASAQ